MTGQRSVAIIGTRGYPSYYGGFETAVRRLAPYLAEHGWDVTVYSRRAGVRLDDESCDPRVRVVFTGGLNSKSLSTLSYGFTSSLHAAARKPDVALIMNVANCFWLPFLKMRGVRTVVNVDGMEWLREKWGRLAKAMFRAGARATARWADDIVVDSREIGRLWKEMFERDGVFIPYGGDRTPTLPLPELGLAKGEYAIMVARLVPENSIEVFLEAALRMAATRDVVIVGSAGYGGPLEDKVKDVVNSSDRIHWFGHISDDALLHSLWQHAGVYFHGHTVGGTNPALVQAMTLGTPVVAVDTVFNREVLDETGIFVASDADEVASTLLAVLDDPALQEDLGHRVQARAYEHYSWELVNTRYERAISAHTSLRAAVPKLAEDAPMPLDTEWMKAAADSASTPAAYVDNRDDSTFTR